MPKHIYQGKVAFEAEGRLLQELGERLVARPDIALVELLKNAYDADASVCAVKLNADGKALLVSDEGVGMTENQFLSRWMKIATAHKVDEPVSPEFGRKRTGQKGIGRFAVRFLGARLDLSSVAYDPSRKIRTRITATFDWKKIDGAETLKAVPIDYLVIEVGDDIALGTTLTVSELRHELDFLQSKEFRTGVLRIVSPLESLDRGKFRRRASGKYKIDPGFRVTLPSSNIDEEEEDVAKQVLDRAWARLRVDLQRTKVEYTVELSGVRKPRTLTIPIRSKISGGVSADIRFFPRRAGVFSGGTIDGRAAWSWVRENCGIALVDQGFRIPPFGFPMDDWLHLDLDSSHNERDWRSSLSKNCFPISDELRARPGDNPALNLPSNYQLVGAVFVETQGADSDSDLTVSMDREGLLQNDAFAELVDVIRCGVEFLAHVDKQQIAKHEEKLAQDQIERARGDFQAAITNIKESPTLSTGDKHRLITHYGELAQKLEEVEEYSQNARRRLETMGLLGVVAGFMTHEAARILDGLETSLRRLRKLAPRDPELASALATIEAGYEAFKGQVDYTSLFVESMHREAMPAFKARPQIDRILERFGAFARDRNLQCDNEMAEDATVVGVPVAAYSGILLNLYTNALKAVLAKEGGSNPAQIVFRGWNEPGKHTVEVLDKGIGIPPELQSRIFDPLFTTTSTISNPLGSGMGLGLSLVSEVVKHSGGKLTIAPPPADFSTCFRVQFKVAR